MNPLTTRERRGMTAISTAACRMLIVAADQRNSMKAVMTDEPGAVSDAELAAAKSDLVRYLANSAPAILLDPEIALPAVVDDGTLARGTALVVGMDASGYETVDGLRYTRFVPGVTARRVRELGGDVAKMLFYVRPDRQGARLATRRPDPRAGARLRRRRGSSSSSSCSPTGSTASPTTPTARRSPASSPTGRGSPMACGAKTLKLQYPGSAEGCTAVTAAAAGVPWAVLSAGVDHATFLEQVRTAMANGASGAMAGRSLWKDSLSISAATRQDYLTTRALPRLRELAAVVDGRAS